NSLFFMACWHGRATNAIIKEERVVYLTDPQTKITCCMKIAELLAQASEPLISYEIIPPQRGGSVEDVLAVVEDLMPFNPPFIDVTSHSAEAYYEERSDGTWRRHVKRKRPGT